MSREVLFRKKFDRYVSVEHRQRVLDLIVVASDRIERPAAARECRDPKDDKYLALALAGKAAVIVSSDVHHLLSMHPWRGIQILSPAEYLFVEHLGRAVYDGIFEPGSLLADAQGFRTDVLSAARPIEIVWEDRPPGAVQAALVLTGDDLKARNDFGTPRRVYPAQLPRPVTRGAKTRLEPPPRSYAAIQWGA